jgi:hypothetical protein
MIGLKDERITSFQTELIKKQKPGLFAISGREKPIFR